LATSAQLPPPPARDVTTGSAAAANNWSPLLQVDRVVWPAIHNRLQSAAPAAVAAMADALQTIGDSGRKLIGLASCVRGEGATTLLSAAARHLLERGRRIVVVDSHWSNPQLARCLGLLPQVGWEESLSNGLPLEEIVIESLADGLAVLPVREPPASAVTNATIDSSMDILARNYDFVLVDLGTLDEIEDGSSPAHGVAARMDALVLVQNVRKTPPHRLSEVRKRLAASKLRYAGTIQNFVAG
jgi:Mrp family chromosome partitioning ATPase